MLKITQSRFSAVQGQTRLAGATRRSCAASSLVVRAAAAEDSEQQKGPGAYIAPTENPIGWTIQRRLAGIELVQPHCVVAWSRN